MKKWLVVGSLILGLGYWSWREITAPAPGELVTDLGREHVAVGTKLEETDEPPTSGPHYGEWTKRGVYEQAIDDGYLIHSLEHGYIVISYKCEGGCEELKKRLREFYEQHKQKRLIVVPRLSLDVPLALTAWGRILKLTEWDEAKAEEFLRAWENRGPEKTME